MTLEETLTPITDADKTGVMTFDQWTGTYCDTYNDVFVGRRRGGKLWEVSERAPGNRSVLHSSHRELSIALDAANKLHTVRRAAQFPTQVEA